MLDTPVYNPGRLPNAEGRQSIANVLVARMDPNLFETNQMQRLIVASGGNLRNLFALVNAAADLAILDGRSKISDKDATSAIVELRSEYERRLGDSLFEENRVPYEKKAERLLKIYNQDKIAQVPDDVLYALLQARAVQEFNGERWFGVHPLVVDILAKQGRDIPMNESGGALGGSI